MKRSIFAVIGSSLLLTFASSAHAGSAEWNLNPTSGDWNTAANWTPATVPNGSADTATFGFSNTTAISNSANTIVNGITFAPGASSFTITAGPALTLTLSGVGIINNSGITQNFIAASTEGGANAIRLSFNNSAKAGSGTIFRTNGGSTYLSGPGWISFNDISSAASGTFINNGPTTASPTYGGAATLFNNSATAANGTFINNGATVSSQVNSTSGATIFNDTSTAAHGTFTNKAASVSGGDGGLTAFSGSATAANSILINEGASVVGAGAGATLFEGLFFRMATAGNAIITNEAASVSGGLGGVTMFDGLVTRYFSAAATAGNATIINNGASVSGAGGGKTIFFNENRPNSFDTSTAGNATLIANGGTGGGRGGTILFEDESTGGTSRIEVFGNGSLDISLHEAPSKKQPSVPIGSVEGDGNVFLGANSLAVGSNNKNTTFSGAIHDGGANGGVGGSLTKIGAGTLALTGHSTYSGDTNIKTGVLQIDGSIASDTFVHHGAVLAGTGTVDASVANNGTVYPGNGIPATLTINGNYTQTSHGVLLIDIAGANAGQSSLLNVVAGANLAGLLDPVLQNGFVPTIGESFVFLDYASLTGKLFIHDRNIDNAPEHWEVIYQATDAILTVVPGNVPIPDQGSTFLLLTFGLSGVVTYRRRFAVRRLL